MVKQARRLTEGHVGAIARLWSLIVCVAVVMGSTFSVMAARPDKSVTPPAVRRVALYRDRAVVERQGSYKVKKGSSVMRFEPFPPALQEVSLRARLGNAPSVRIAGVSSWIDRRSEIQDARVREVNEQVQELKSKINELSASLRTVRAVDRYLSAYEATLKKAISEQTLVSSPQTDAWHKTLVALNGRRRELDLQRSRGDRKLATLSTDLGMVSKELRQLENPEPRAVRIVEIQLESEAVQQVELGILYEMSNAGWDAIYEVREDAEGRVQLEYAAGLRQSTEEDWQDVQLTLSTAEPAMGGVRPRLRGLRVSAAKAQKAAGANIAVVDTVSERATDIALVETAAAMEMEVRQEATSFALDLPHKVTIPRDGRLVKVPVAKAALEGATELWAVPDVRRHVYRRLATSNPFPVPLLPGNVMTYHRDSYVGMTRLGFVPVSGKFMVSTGTDPEIQVEKHYSTDAKRSSSVFDQTYTKCVTVRNQKNRDVTVRLAYAVPVSEVEEARVTLYRSRFSVAPGEEDKKRGHLFWDLNVSAGSAASHSFVYRLVGPFDLMRRQAKPTGDFGLLELR
ncbi:MAG: mucoidy inhibitor MuiA family protein [Kiritimatiellae bacterium]|nr:mucoidy inhibitor MuiA family protein [Kiritimatiellia bacterium]